MKIALAQLNYTIGDIEGNKSKIIGAVERAKSEGADLVVFAEQALSGTPALDLLCKTTFIELCEEALDEIASHCGRIAAVVGVPVLTECGTVSAAAVIQHGEVERCISKRFITARREMGFLVQGSGCETITICGERVAVIVGDDLSRTSNFDKSVDLILSINARRFGKGMMTYRYNTMHDLAYVESKRIMLINQVGGSTEIVYDGTSAVVGADGQIELLMKSFEEDFAIFDTRAEHEPIAVPYTTYKDRTRMVYSAAVCGLHDYFGKNGYTKAAIGLSGGIDSAVVACLAVAVFVRPLGGRRARAGRQSGNRLRRGSDYGGLQGRRRYDETRYRRYGVRRDGGEHPGASAHGDADGSAKQMRVYPAQLLEQERKCTRFLYALRRYGRCVQRDGRPL